MDSIHSKAREARQAGELSEAAEYYAAIAAYKLAAAGHEPIPTYRKGLANALRAVSLEATAGNRERARGHADLFRPAIDRLAAAADEPTVVGLAHEWAGDMAFICGDHDEATAEYERARESFGDLSLEAQLHWGARLEYDVAFMAAERFFESLGEEYYADHDIDFAGRVDWKLDVIDRVRSA